jgi:hypothetical protein
MGKFIITEEEKNRIKGLYEQTTTETTPNNTALNPTSDKPLCNNKTGTGGTGTETEYNACVYKIGDAVVITMKDKNGAQVAGGNGQDFNSAYRQLVGQTDKLGKTIGKDLPIPINPDQQ